MGLCQAKRGVFGSREFFLDVSCWGPSYAHLIILPEQDITFESIYFSAFGSVEFPLESLSISSSPKPQNPDLKTADLVYYITISTDGNLVKKLFSFECSALLRRLLGQIILYCCNFSC